MKNIVVIGQSPAVHVAVKAVLDRDPSVSVTLISCDGQLPYDRMLLPGLIDRSVQEKNIFCAPEDFYKTTQVQLILDKEISRINFNRRRIFLADKVQVDFDSLIIADAPQLRLPAFKGVRRQGVFHLARLGAVRDLVRYLMHTETALIEPLGFAGIRTALALKAVGKDVIVVMRQASLLADVIPVPRSQDLVCALEKRGVRVICGGIDDIIGETEVKAVRLKSGKVVACDMVVIEDVMPDLRFLQESELLIDERIPVTGPMRTNIDGVCALDAVCKADAPAFTGPYAVSTDIGFGQAVIAVAGLWGDEGQCVDAGREQQDILGTFFHPQELMLPAAEVTT